MEPGTEKVHRHAGLNGLRAEVVLVKELAEPSSFRIDPINLCLWRSTAAGVEERVELTPKTFDVLRYLADHAGRLVTHDELLDALWPDVHVQPEVLKSHILAIRQALGDRSGSPRFIETQRGRGYRFIGAMNGCSAPAPTRPQAVIELGVFAGRAEPLQALATLFHRAASGEPQTAFVSGEPGIGKTTLVQQFLAHTLHHSSVAVAQGCCIEGFAGAEPYYPVLEAIEALCKGAGAAGVARKLVTLAPAWASQMPGVVSAGQRTALHGQSALGAQSRMVREACSFLEAVAAERPLVLMLEDLHWADFATIDLISALCRRRSLARLMLIGTYRPEDLKTARHPLKQMTRDLALRKYCTEIELGPLADIAIAELLAQGAGGDPQTAAFARFIQERTAGNPLFMRVTLEHLLQRREVERTADGWRPLGALDKLAAETPPTLARVIESKIEGMSEEQRRVLEAASVAGDPFDPVTTAAAAGMDAQTFESVCEGFTCRTIRRDKLVVLPDNQLVRTYAFNHALYRQVFYERIGPMRRAHLHRALATRLEEIYPPDQRGDVVKRLAHHFECARDWPRALHYLRSALALANARSARRDALAILDRAVALTANLPDAGRIPLEIELLERRATIEAMAHDPTAHETYARLVERTRQGGDIDAQCRALAGASYPLSWDDARASLRIVDELLALCDRQPDPIQQDLTRVTAHMRRVWVAGWDPDDAQKCEAALLRLRENGGPLDLALAQANFSMLCMISTRYAETLDLLDGSYRVLSEAPQSLIEADLARLVWMRQVGVPWALLSLGDLGGALKEFDAGIAAFEGNDDLAAARSLRIYRGVLLFHALDFEGVLEACASVAADAALRVLPVERRLALILSGLAEAGLGNNAAAAAHLDAAEAEMALRPVHLDWYWRLALEWGRVNLLLSDSDHGAALVRAQRLCALATQTAERAWQALAWEARARAALARGDAAQARDSVVKALAACQGVTVPLAEWRVYATAARACEAAGDVRQAEAHSRQGAAIRKRLAATLAEGDPLRLKFERPTAAERREAAIAPP